MLVESIIIGVFATAVAAWDIWQRRIPKELNVAGMIAGLSLHVLHGNIGLTLVTVATAFLVSLVLFQLGAIGGGDAKLFIAMAALLGMRPWLVAVCLTFAFSAIMSVVLSVAKGRFLATARNVGELAKHMAYSGVTAHPAMHVRDDTAMRVPIGPAAAFGIAGALIAYGGIA